MKNDEGDTNHPLAGCGGNVEKTLVRRNIRKSQFEANVFNAYGSGAIAEAKDNVRRYVIVRGIRFSVNDAFRANGINPAYGETSVPGQTANPGDMIRAAYRLGLDTHGSEKPSAECT